MNEIKVGQWTRIETFERYKILEIVGTTSWCGLTCYYLKDEGTDIYLPQHLTKTADNLVDLLEVGDIVHYTIPLLTKPIEYIIESENALKWIQQKLISNVYKITAIELHENRVKQVIG